MAKGRNTTLLTTRISDLMFETIQGLVQSKGMTMSEYVRGVLEADEELRLRMLYRAQMNSMGEQERGNL